MQRTNKISLPLTALARHHEQFKDHFYTWEDCIEEDEGSPFNPHSSNSRQERRKHAGDKDKSFKKAHKV
ncbi:hypothetical protein LguiB_006732 [Lonicera macranthoides]